MPVPAVTRVEMPAWSAFAQVRACSAWSGTSSAGQAQASSQKTLENVPKGESKVVGGVVVSGRVWKPVPNGRTYQGRGGQEKGRDVANDRRVNTWKRGSDGGGCSSYTYPGGRGKSRSFVHERLLHRQPLLRLSGSLDAGLEELSAGGCAHFPEMLCKASDLSLFHALEQDIGRSSAFVGKHRRSAHLRIFGESLLHSSPPFVGVLDRVLALFGVTLVDCWLNIYRHAGEHKNLHRDRYEDRYPVPELTLGISFGAARDLVLQHKRTQKEFRVCQGNGDVFVFDAAFNNAFRHGVARGGPAGQNSGAAAPTSKRLSIAVWARRDFRSEMCDGREANRVTVCPAEPPNLNAVPEVWRAPMTGWADDAETVKWVDGCGLDVDILPQ